MTQEVSLSAQATVLEEVVVNAAAEQGTVNAAVATQQQAVAIVNARDNLQIIGPQPELNRDVVDASQPPGS